MSMETTQVCIVDETGRKVALMKVESGSEMIAYALRNVGGIPGARSDRLIEVVSWMVARSASGCLRSVPAPHVDLASLHTLAMLLESASVQSQSTIVAQHWTLTQRVGKISMPRQSMTYQFDLFSAPHWGTTVGIPRWPEFPNETR